MDLAGATLPLPIHPLHGREEATLQALHDRTEPKKKFCLQNAKFGPTVSGVLQPGPAEIWRGPFRKRNRNSVCKTSLVCQRVRADAVVLARLSFSEASLALSCEWECWNDMKVVTFRLVGAWPMGAWTPHGDCARQVNFLAAFLSVATTKAWEKLNKCAKPKWKQTTTQASKRDEVALRLTNNNDEIWAWTPGCAGQVSALSLLSSSSAKRPWQSSREVEKIAPNQNGSKLRGRAKLDEESLAFDERSHLAYGLIADQISAPVLSAPTDLLREQIRWSTAPTVLGQTEPAEPPNRTPDPAAPSDLVLLLGTNRMRPGYATRGPRGSSGRAHVHVPASYHPTPVGATQTPKTATCTSIQSALSTTPSPHTLTWYPSVSDWVSNSCPPCFYCPNW